MDEKTEAGGGEPAGKKLRRQRDDATDIFIPAGLFLGLGAGFLLDNVRAGVCLGLGFGFLGMGIAKIVLRGTRRN